MQFVTWTETPANWQHLKHHPLSTVVGFGVGLDIDAMAAFMKQHGYDDAEPIVLWYSRPDLCDMILDGRHKHAAAVKAGVIPTFARFVGKDPTVYVAKKAHRQHLNESQRAMIAATLVTTKVGSNQHEGGSAKRHSLQDAADTMNVSRRSVHRASTVIADGTPELQQAVSDGTVSVSEAAQIADKPADEQKKAVKQKKSKPKGASAKRHSLPDDLEEDELVDADGNTVPAKLRFAFGEVATLKKLAGRCKSLGDALTKLESTQLWECLHHFGANLRKGSGGVKSTATFLEAIIPARPCCEEKKCKLCGGKGFLTLDEIEEDVK